MNIEAEIIAFLAARLPVPVYGDRPDLGTVDEFVTVEKTGSGYTDRISRADIAVQSWSTSRFAAGELNELAKAAVAEAVNLDCIRRCALETDYNYPDLASKRPRYQALFEIVYDD